MREQSRKPQAERSADSGPGYVRVRGLGVFDAADVRKTGRPLGARNLSGADGRPGSGQRGGASNSSDPIEQHRTIAIAISTAAVILGYLLIQYLDLMGPR